MTASTILLDEHVSRIFENVLRERDYSVEQAKDRFGEETVDFELLQWCAEYEHVLLSIDILPRLKTRDSRALGY